MEPEHLGPRRGGAAKVGREVARDYPKGLRVKCAAQCGPDQTIAVNGWSAPRRMDVDARSLAGVGGYCRLPASRASNGAASRGYVVAALGRRLPVALVEENRQYAPSASCVSVGRTVGTARNPTLSVRTYNGIRRVVAETEGFEPSIPFGGMTI